MLLVIMIFKSVLSMLVMGFQFVWIGWERGVSCMHFVVVDFRIFLNFAKPLRLSV